MADITIRRVLVISAGNIGLSAINHLLATGKYDVSVLTSSSSKAKIPTGAKHFTGAYNDPKSVAPAFQNQDVVISTISGPIFALQNSLIDLAIAANVKWFLPSEYGIDSAVPSSADIIPFLKDKLDTAVYLKSKQNLISWTSLVVGNVFDWGLGVPGFGGINIAERAAVIYDGGKNRFDASTIPQISRAILGVLEHPNVSKDRYVYVNSFSITQEEVVGALEKATGTSFKKSEDTVKNLREKAFAQLKTGEALAGVLALVASANYGYPEVTNFSETRGLWNDALGLPKEDLESVVAEFVG